MATLIIFLPLILAVKQSLGPPDILVAVYNGDVDRVSELVQYEDINVRDMMDNSAIEIAVATGNKEMVELVLKSNYQITRKDSKLLPFLITNGMFEIAEILLTNGLSVDCNSACSLASVVEKENNDKYFLRLLGCKKSFPFLQWTCKNEHSGELRKINLDMAYPVVHVLNGCFIMKLLTPGLSTIDSVIGLSLVLVNYYVFMNLFHNILTESEQLPSVSSGNTNCDLKTIIKDLYTHRFPYEVQVEGSDECPICLQELSHPVVRWGSCSPKHIFHRVCAASWLRTGKLTCPVCRG
jgi:hypothetical protein